MSLLVVLLLVGCKQIDGTYQPGCPAFEGDTIVLQDGRVTWDRFTDQIIVDADGNALDPFPDFPQYGNYEVDGNQLHLAIDGKSTGATLHIRRVGERVLLLNTENLAEYERTGEYNDCTLTLAPEEAQ